MDDYPTVLESIGRRLRLGNLDVHEAGTGEEAVGVALRLKLDLALIDYHLPGINGGETALTIRKQGIHLPWILFSAVPDHTAAFEAGKVGALRVVWTPFNAYDVVLEAFRALSQQKCCSLAAETDRRSSECAACCSRSGGRVDTGRLRRVDDPSTLELWAKRVGTSYSQLRSTYSQLGIAPHDARDFMRLLRALWCVQGRVEHVVSHLVIGDSRTTDVLMERAGLVDFGDSQTLMMEDFLRSQRFIASEHPMPQSLRTLFRDLKGGLRKLRHIYQQIFRQIFQPLLSCMEGVARRRFAPSDGATCDESDSNPPSL